MTNVKKPKITDTFAHLDLTSPLLYPNITIIALTRSFDAIIGVDKDGSNHLRKTPSEIVNIMNSHISRRNFSVLIYYNSFLINFAENA